MPSASRPPQLGVPLGSLRVAIQGCGSIGAAAAGLLAANVSSLRVADVVATRAQSVARETGATVVPPDDVLTSDVDVLVPCAHGGAVDEETAKHLRARIVCPGANNAVTEGAQPILLRREVLVVPDELSSAGAVIAGMSTALGATDQIDARMNGLAVTLEQIFNASIEQHEPTSVIANALAQEIIAANRPTAN